LQSQVIIFILIEMKKTGLFLLLVLGTVIAYSQSLSLIYEGDPIPANHEIVLQSNPNSGEVIIEDILVKNNSANYLVVKAKKIENYLIPETQNMFCWAGLCYSPDTYVSPLFDTIFPGQITLPGEFAGHYLPMSNPGQSSVSYVFFDMNNPNDSVMVTVLYDATLTGIAMKDLSPDNISDPYPNPANQYVRFDYQVNDPAMAQLKVYSLIGTLVNEVSFSSDEGTLQLATRDLKDGFYFYVLSSGSQQLKTGRFVVRH
jgi:hypothetical protein